jgi:hypothetical protein
VRAEVIVADTEHTPVPLPYPAIRGKSGIYHLWEVGGKRNQTTLLVIDGGVEVFVTAEPNAHGWLNLSPTAFSYTRAPAGTRVVASFTQE